MRLKTSSCFLQKNLKITPGRSRLSQQAEKREIRDNISLLLAIDGTSRPVRDI